MHWRSVLAETNSVNGTDSVHFKVVHPSGQDRSHEIKDCVHILKDKGRTVFDVLCKLGIGSAKIVLVEGSWPERMVVQLHLSALEGFIVTNNKLRFLRNMLDVTAYDNKGNLFEQKYLLEKRGFYEVKLPTVLFDKDTREIKITWVEFYLR